MRTPSVSDLLRRHRHEAGLTQEELAERANLSREAVSALERGERQSPRRQTLQLLSDALGIDGAARAELVRAAAWARTSPADSVPFDETALLDDGCIGRGDDLRAVSALLSNPDVRLLTLIGPAGVGKTRLALALTRAYASRQDGSAALVSLAELDDASQVGCAIRRALEPSDVSAGHERLLVLDTFEHVRAAATDVVELLAAARGLKVVVTSRAPLHVAGEQEYHVAPLDLDAAIDLFVARVRAIHPGYVLSEEHAEDIAAICRRLDCVPLAIEMAAERLRVLTPGTLLRRLEESLHVLSHALVECQPRHATMHTAIDWSFALLDEQQQRLLRWLAVFPDEFSVAQVEAIGTARGAPATPAAILPMLEELVALQLVHSSVAGRTEALRLLNTTRQFAWHELEASGEADAARASQRHARGKTRVHRNGRGTR